MISPCPARIAACSPPTAQACAGAPCCALLLPPLPALAAPSVSAARACLLRRAARPRPLRCAAAGSVARTSAARVPNCALRLGGARAAPPGGAPARFRPPARLMTADDLTPLI